MLLARQRVAKSRARSKQRPSRADEDGGGEETAAAPPGEEGEDEEEEDGEEDEEEEEPALNESRKCMDSLVGSHSVAGA